MSAGFSESFIQVYNLKRVHSAPAIAGVLAGLHLMRGMCGPDWRCDFQENLRKLRNGLDLMDIVTGPGTSWFHERFLASTYKG